MTATICSICLRSNINLRSITSENLVNFYDELCDFGSGFKSKFCSVCLYKLKKCYEFKKHCRLAVETLKTWMKQPKADKKPKHLLYTAMPTPHLSLCHKNNYKVYHQSADLDMAVPIHILNKHPHIIIVNIPRDDDTEMPDSPNLKDVGQINEKHTIEVSDIKIEYINSADNENEPPEKFEVSSVKSENNSELVVQNLPHDDLPTDDDSNDLDYTVKDNIEPHSDSDSNMEVDLETRKIKHKRKPINVDDLKTKLKEKFERCGTVKDEKGNVINVDIVLNNLVVSRLFPIKKLCLGPGPFSPLAIRKLSEICNTASLFETLRLNNHEEMQAEFEKRRLSLNYTKHPHRCESCLKGFLHRPMLDFHIKTSHNTALPFECSICHMRLGTRDKLSSHRSTHRNVLKCKLCAFSAGKRGIMVEHVNKHKGVKYTCVHCEKDFTTRTSLAAHVNAAHEARHACARCAAAFNTARGLEVHRHKKHAGEEFVQSEDNKKCEECNIIFISSEVYGKHMRITHKVRGGRARGNMIYEYSCRVCDWKGSSRRLQMDHYQSEHPDADSKFLHSGSYLCHDCGQRFKSVTAYTDHMNKHTGTRPYSCTKCSKAFFSRLNLDSHILRHLPPTKECPHCGKKFTTGTGLSSHIRIHRNDRRYKCNICGKGFLYNSAICSPCAESLCVAFEPCPALIPSASSRVVRAPLLFPLHRVLKVQ